MGQDAGKLVICLLLVICVSLVPPGALAHQTPPPYPTLEPNDHFSAATEIEPRTLHGLEAIKFINATPGPGIDRTGFWGFGDDDEDIYAVDLETWDEMPVTVYHAGDDGNLKFTIYDPSGAELRTVDPDGNWKRTGSGLFPEKGYQKGNTTITARCSGTHYVEVENEGSQSVPYRIEVDDRFEHNDEPLAAPLLSRGTYDRLMITTYDKDFYRLHVGKGEEVEVEVDITPHAHWERGVDSMPYRHAGRKVTRDEWQPYDHPRWRDPSFEFNVLSFGSSGADYRLKAVSQVPNDELHRDTLLFEAKETGSVYIGVRTNIWWDSPIDGAPKWKANSARYSLDIKRDSPGSSAASSPQKPDGDGERVDAVKSALDRVSDRMKNDDLGVVGSQFKGETVNVHVEGEGVYSFEVTENLELAGLQGCGSEEATMRVDADRDVVRAVGNSSAPANELRTAYRDGDVRISGIGRVDEVKWAVFNGVYDLVKGLPI